MPGDAIVALAIAAWLLVLSGQLELIIEFGSLTFLVVSLLMAIANMKMREETKTSLGSCLLAVAGLTTGGVCIIGWQATQEPHHLLSTGVIVGLLRSAAHLYGTHGPHRIRENVG